MKKDRKKNNLLEEEVDLSIIKNNDLEDTASFTDLMSRKERKKHKKDKTNNTIELETIKTDDNDVEFETEELAQQISENKTVEIKEQELKEIANATLEDTNETSEIKEKKDFKNIFNTVFISLLIICAIGIFIYAIINTNFLNKNLYLMIDGICLLLLVFNYCLMIISSNKKAIILTIFNYLLLLAGIAFNILIYFKII